MKVPAFFALTVAASLLSVLPAQAQDGFSWNGFYAGVEGGTASGRGDGLYLGNNGDPDPNGDDNPDHVFVASADPGSPESFDLSGGLFGGHVGFMHQMGGLVLGLDGAYDRTNISGKLVYNPNTDPVGKFDYDLTSVATINARLGVANGRWLAYATAGLAFGTLNITDSGNCGEDCIYVIKGSATARGWDAGAGVAYAATNNIIIGAEYLHVDLGSTDVTLNDTCGEGCDFFEKVRVRNVVDQVKARVSFKFGGN